MKSLWDAAEAARYEGDLAQRVYSSRLLGRQPSLVLHGGGNTSVKSTLHDVWGAPVPVLYVKGSGGDLATIEAAGFAPCRLDYLLRLAELPALSDVEMARQLRLSLTDPAAPSPSVEAILHAILPSKFVDHTHADAFLAVCNTPHGEERVRELYGDRVVVVPYVMPGFQLARCGAELFRQQAGPQTIGMALLHHGLFSFGATARESYERMIELVSLAEARLPARPVISVPPLPPPGRVELAALRRQVSEVAGFPMVMRTEECDFVRHPQAARWSQQGPATPDHVLRTKRLPLWGRDVAGYAEAYRRYFAQWARPGLTMLDAAPRVILDPAWGMCALGRSAREAAVVADIYRHTMEIILRAAALEDWQALPAREIFEVEYWDLEQAKLRQAGAPPVFAGEVAWVSGAASGIGRACVESLLRRGAAVVGLDREPMAPAENFHGVVCELTDRGQVQAALDEGVRRFGGLDMLVLNAGIFPPSAPIAALGDELWRRVMAVNLDATMALMREAHPLLKLAPRGGRVVVIGSKNVPAPGPGAAAYSASKAAVNQLARVAALEWAAVGIRVNTLHPHLVLDTGLWTPELLESRARQYGMTVTQYKTNNLLHTEITSRDVAELAAALCTDLFAKTTGAQLPVDGGNERVI